MATESVRVFVLGASGMLGHVVLRLFSRSPGFSAIGSARSSASIACFDTELRQRVVCGIDIENADALAGVLADVRPAVVVNCVGLVKQLAQADDPLSALPINALLPHRLARWCALAGARLIHISTDCVFSGMRGGYREDDPSDATDLYGRSKYLGEVDQPHAVTLRTSIIGPELGSAHGLVGWFLSQRGAVKGYRRAVFSGLPTVELAKLIRDHVIPRPDLRGVYHASAAPIDKYTLLGLVSRAYSHRIAIEPDDRVVIDRSLDSTRLRSETGWTPAEWPDLVQAMRDFG